MSTMNDRASYTIIPHGSIFWYFSTTKGLHFTLPMVCFDLGAQKQGEMKLMSKKQGAIKEPMTKSQIVSSLAESADLSKKQVSTLFDELAELIERHIKQRGAGQFTLPGLLKIVVKKKPATKARKGINPFTGEETIFKAKPASKVVKLKALKKLKDMVA